MRLFSRITILFISYNNIMLNYVFKMYNKLVKYIHIYEFDKMSVDIIGIYYLKLRYLTGYNRKSSIVLSNTLFIVIFSLWQPIYLTFLLVSYFVIITLPNFK